MPRSVVEKNMELARLISYREFEQLHRDYQIRYFFIGTRADERRRTASVPPVVYEDSQMRIYGLASK